MREKPTKTSVNYCCQFDNGEHIASFNTVEEAMNYRSENNFHYISRSIHVYKQTWYMYEDGYGYVDSEKIV